MPKDITPYERLEEWTRAISPALQTDKPELSIRIPRVKLVISRQADDSLCVLNLTSDDPLPLPSDQLLEVMFGERRYTARMSWTGPYTAEGKINLPIGTGALIVLEVIYLRRHRHWTQTGHFSPFTDDPGFREADQLAERAMDQNRS